MDQLVYNTLSETDRKEFWVYIDRTGYGTLTLVRYEQLGFASQGAWWSRFEREFDNTFIPPDIPRPTSMGGDGLGTLINVIDTEQEVTFEEEDGIDTEQEDEEDEEDDDLVLPHWM